MRQVAVIITALILLLSTAAQEQREYGVSLSASPPECATALLGSGSYREGSQATLEVRASLECRFVKWVLSGGGLPREVSANPFTFYVFGDVQATAVLEKLYRDNGTVITRVYVAFTANITSNALNLPKPRIVKPGEVVEFSAPTEVLDGDFKYVFLFWRGPDGLGIDQPHGRIAVNASTTLVANYYAFKRFLDEYYPLHLFVRPSFQDIELPDGRVQRAEAMKVAGVNKTLPIQPVPEPLLSLIEPVYRTYVPYIISVDSPKPVKVTVNKLPLEIGSSVKMMDREGSSVVIEAPSKTPAVRLVGADLSGRILPLTGSDAELIAVTLQTPVIIHLRYIATPHGFLTEMPIIDEAAYSVADMFYSLLSLFTRDAYSIPVYVAIAAPLAVVATAGAGAYFGVRKITQGGVRAAIRTAGSLRLRDRISPLLERESAPEIVVRRTELPPNSRLTMPESLKLRLEDIEYEPVPEPSVEDDTTDAWGKGHNLTEKVDELLEKLHAGEEGTFPSSILQLIPFDEELFEAVQSRRIRLNTDDTPALYLTQAARLYSRVTSMPSGLITVSGGDEEMRNNAVEYALKNAGRKWVRLGRDTILPTDEAGIRAFLKKLNADSIILYGYNSRQLSQAAITSKKLVISILQDGGDIVFPEISDDMLPGVAASMLAEKDLIKRLSYTEFEHLLGIARCFRKTTTVKTFINLLDEEGLPPSEALDQLWTREFREAFPGFETKIALTILKQNMTYEAARDLYITAYKQVTPGGDAAAAWRAFLSKLEKLGMRVEN
ncbi:MAG: hypothetical protein QXW52_08885 [Candidatus Caldarchaeum sp.]